MTPPSGGEGAPGEPGPSRRQLLSLAGRRLGAAGAAGGLLTACGSSASEPAHRRPPSQRGRDVAALNRLLDLVRPTIAAYTAGIPLLAASLQGACQNFLSEELVHAGRLIVLIRAAHGRPHAPAPRYDLGHQPRRHRTVLELLHRLESRELSGYLNELPGVSQVIRPDLASILANNAQHLTILRGALGQPPIPSAFLTAGE